MSDVAARSSPGGRDGVLKSDVSTRKDQRNPDVKRSAPVRIEQNDRASRHLNVPALGFHSKKNAETGPLGVRFSPLAIQARETYVAVDARTLAACSNRPAQTIGNSLGAWS